MPDARPSYFELLQQEQAEILMTMAGRLGKRPATLEKDIWLSKVLEVLFGLPAAQDKPMAFKGGTSLSKVFNAIQRFSEDIDVTVNFQHLGQDLAEQVGVRKLSNSERQKLDLALKAALYEHIKDRLVPGLQLGLNSVGAKVEIDPDNPEKVWVRFPSVVAQSTDYLKPGVLLEFGGRNATDPSDVHIVRPDVADHVAAIEFPEARVNTLSPSRTFWEKATLIHVACHRETQRANPDRESRHWYDLAQLSKHAIGVQSLADIALMDDVLTIKRVFFNSGYANYDLCESGKFKLVPEGAVLEALREDYNQMVAWGMFDGSAPTFDEVLADVSTAQQRINAAVRAYRSSSNTATLAEAAVLPDLANASNP